MSVKLLCFLVIPIDAHRKLNSNYLPKECTPTTTSTPAASTASSPADTTRAASASTSSNSSSSTAASAPTFQERWDQLDTDDATTYPTYKPDTFRGLSKATRPEALKQARAWVRLNYPKWIETGKQQLGIQKFSHPHHEYYAELVMMARYVCKSRLALRYHAGIAVLDEIIAKHSTTAQEKSYHLGVINSFRKHAKTRCANNDRA